jgi:parvulin-like peptidyl-prolyl isomerase
MKTGALVSTLLFGACVAVAAAQDDDAEAKRRATVLASFTGGAITVADLEDDIAGQSRFMRQRYKEDPERRKELLEKKLRLAILAAEAERRNFATDDLVQTSVKQNAVQALVRQEFDEKITADSIPADEITQYYETHLDEFVKPQMRRASHILLKDKAAALALMKDAAAADVRGFRDLARKHSLDEDNKLRGGDLRYFRADGRTGERKDDDARVTPALADAAFALGQVGDVVATPIELDNGYSILKLTGIREGASKDPASASDTIRMRLWREKRQAAIEALIQQLREAHKPVTKPRLLDAIQFDATAPTVKGKGIPPGFPVNKPAK